MLAESDLTINLLVLGLSCLWMLFVVGIAWLFRRRTVEIMITDAERYVPGDRLRASGDGGTFRVYKVLRVDAVRHVVTARWVTDDAAL